MANNFKNQFSAGVGTSPSSVYVAGIGVQATIIGMSIANVLTSPITVNVIINSNGFNYYMVKDASIDPGSSLIPIGGDQKLVLEPNDSILVISNTAASADVILSLLEIS
jgi:hypothetical protein